MGMMSHTETGVLVLADISGFTAFVTTTELEHGPPIIADLLEKVMRELAPPLEIQEVEGDAVFALGTDRAFGSPPILLDVLHGAFVAFRARQREMQAANDCSCQACENIGSLDLKIVAHHGRYLRQWVGGRDQAAGTDVILVHRLLKNRLLRRRAYLLFTEAALAWMGVDPGATGLIVHTERYDYLGDVRCFVRDLDGQASSTSALMAIAPSGVAAQSSQPPAVGRPRSSNGAVSKSGARAWVA
jgi:hypothetical protein